MSYSICLNCEEMVPRYEKYCRVCVMVYDLRQDEEYWRTHKWPADTRDRRDEINRDMPGAQ